MMPIVVGDRSMASVAVLLPAYNEELTLEATMRAFHAALPSAAIWVINNRSVDRTEAVALATFAQLGCAGGVLHEDRRSGAPSWRSRPTST